MRTRKPESISYELFMLALSALVFLALTLESVARPAPDARVIIESSGTFKPSTSSSTATPIGAF